MKNQKDKGAKGAKGAISSIHRLDYISPKYPIKSLRLGYPGTGYSFYLTRCLDVKAFVEHVRGTNLDPLMTVDQAPVAKCYPLWGQVLPGVFEEAAGGALCEIHLVVIVQDDQKVEHRHWRHEVGHAAAFASEAFPSLCAGKARMEQKAYDAARVAVARVEVPAYVTEFLCEALDQALVGPVTEVSSGLPSLYDLLGGIPSPQSFAPVAQEPATGESNAETP